MKTLTIASIISVLCTVLVWLCVVPALVRNEMVDVDSRFVAMVVFPTLVGLPTSLIGAVAGLIMLVRRVDRGWPRTLMAVGQLITWALAVTIIVWAMGFASTGWELIALPTSLILGQIVVAAGLITAIVGQRKHTVGRVAHAST